MHKPVYNCGRGFDTTIFVRGQEYDPWIINPTIDVDVDASPVHRLRHISEPQSRDDVGDGDLGEAVITRGMQLGVRHPVAPSWQRESIAGPGC